MTLRQSASFALRSLAVRRGLRRGRPGRFVFLAAMPKSGSTFLSRALSRALGYEVGYLGYAYSNTEQELYEPRIVERFGEGFVVQQHLRASAPNLDLLARYGIRPVVLTRNVFDVVVSVREHLLSEGLDRIPSLFVSRAYGALSPAMQLDTIIRLFCPWLIGFYVSWYQADSIDKIWLSYDDCVGDWVACVGRVLDFHGLEVAPPIVAAALDASSGDPRSRINKGVPGRGAMLLSPAQQDRIRELTEPFPEVDFAPIGL
ncbi:MAG TPA: hypothetical protein VK849_09760 [Longimicrobiales bacterium]|nr:hypothetical protein [Longimicrobiales bacterium]